MMAFFRNREIKYASFLLLGICLAIIAVGMVIGITTGIFSIISCMILCTTFLAFTRRRYKNIAFLCEQIDIVLHGNDSFPIDACNEGELSILQSEIQKMVVRLREHSDILKKDKIYLSDSMADIAHQLRTPLTSINMLVSFLGKPDLDLRQRTEFVRELEGLLSRIDWLLVTLLNISKIDAGTAIFQKEPVSVNALIKKAAEPLMIPLELRNIELRIRGGDGECFTGDLNWTAEAIGNIIKNCMEHTGNGGLIEISHTQNAVYTEIRIKDNGSGIDKEDLPHIFERFYQGKHTKNGNFGIGLALCRMILSVQNATVKAVNVKDGGACFSVRFYHHIV